jgi:outer membrane protein assembly factor BamB
VTAGSSVKEAVDGAGVESPAWHTKKLAVVGPGLPVTDAPLAVTLAAQFGKYCNATMAMRDDTVVTVCQEDDYSNTLYWLKNGGVSHSLTAAQAPYVRYVEAILADGTIVASTGPLPDFSSKLFWIKDGQVVAEYVAEGRMFDARAAALSDGTIVIGAAEAAPQGYQLLWLKNGVLTRAVPMASRFRPAAGRQNTEGALAALPNDTVIVAANQAPDWLAGPFHNEPPLAKVFAFDVQGRPAWEYEVNGKIMTAAVPYEGSKYVIGVEIDNETKVLWLEGSTVLHTYAAPTNSSGLGSSPAVRADGTVVVGTSGERNKTYWLKDGTLLKAASFDDGWQASPPALLADGTTVVASQAGRVVWDQNGTIRASWMLEDGQADRGNIVRQPLVLSDGTVVIAGVRNDIGLAWLRLHTN